ncbi:MAG: hypothetical protein OJF52_001688 [Nitrospira sp.]|jgi:uncharacterized iron-regulated membrane protein|nr:MAG: hypothetical protein OJF52_001688 [Nitrospira sp.]
MAKGDRERRVRLLHRWIGLSSLAFLLLSVVTGLLWANARFVYFDDHYKEKIRPLKGPAVESAKLSIRDVLREHATAWEGSGTVEQIALRPDFGRLVYELRLRFGKSAKSLLIDADTGERLSPIGDDLAARIARQYVRVPADVTSVTTEQYTPRKKHQAVEAVRVTFNDREQTHIILDRQSGEILEDEGRWRKFHFLVMQLHQLNFFGFEKTLLNIPGVPLLLMGITGLALWAIQTGRKKRTRLT